MAKSTKLKVMLSSRCDDVFPLDKTGRPLSEIRRQLKAELEQEGLFGKQIFEVWINEDTAPQTGALDSWEVCLQSALDCDILICLSNGNAGWAKDPGAIGICHAELMTGSLRRPARCGSFPSEISQLRRVLTDSETGDSRSTSPLRASSVAGLFPTSML